MILIGGKCLSWTNFKTKHLISVNLAVVASFLLWKLRGDFLFHPVILVWMAGTFTSQKLLEKEKQAMFFVGKMNGLLILSFFYFLIFSPFSILYRFFFRHQSFKKSSSSFQIKDSVSPFDRPF